MELIITNYNKLIVSQVKKAVTENDEILETERGNCSRSSNSKQKRETQTESSSKKKKILLAGDLVNVISEKGFSVNHKVKIVNFSGGASEKILEKLDGIIKEKPDELIVHVGTNDITNNANLLSNVKKIFNKVSKESPSTSIAFSPIINRKETFACKKELVSLITMVLRNFI